MPEGSTILVIDDEDIICDSCRQVLMREGYKVGIAKDGSTGLQKVREMKPDLALVDLKMPGISGMEVLEKIRAIDANIITVVITGYATVESAVEAMKRGAYDFIPKPFTPDELRIITKRGLERRKLAIESATLREEKEKMKKNFITMVSHELKTPLVAIQQYFEVILGGTAGKVTTEQREMIVRASARINGLLILINDWLNMARIEASKLVEKFEPLNIATILHETMESMQLLAKDKNISLQIDLPDNLPMIQGDKETLREVFTNLIGNGIRYNRDNGAVNIRVEEEDAYLVVKVSDTGIGIPKEHLPFIFDEFYRVKSKETQGITGTGLGLSIVKRIVEAHSGYIKVESEPGKGSSFSVLLPKIGEEHR